MNIAVLAWETDHTGEARDDEPVHVRMLKNWDRVRTAFPCPRELEEDVIKRLSEIQTYADYERTYGRMGPYTPFDFTTWRPSTESPERTLATVAEFFLVEP